MTDKLLSRIKEKPIKYGLQTVVTLAFASDTLNGIEKTAEFIHKYEPELREFTGAIGYWGLQVVPPLLMGAAIATVGYIAVKGTGIVMNKAYETKPASEK